MSQGLFDVSLGAEMPDVEAQAALVLDLPLDMPRPRANSFRGRGVSAYIPVESARGLESWASRSRSSIFSATFAAFFVLVCSWSTQEVVAVGSTYHGQD